MYNTNGDNVLSLVGNANQSVITKNEYLHLMF